MKQAKRRGADVTVKVPGKLMLAGEYSVLSGGMALAVTLDRHLTVHAKLLPEGEGVHVGSSLWDEPRRTVAGAPPTGEPLVDAAARGAALFGVPHVALRIDSELDVRHGTGSSSAVRLGALLALEELSRSASGAPKERPKDELWPTARAAYLLQKDAQGAASGYDVATQLLGGLVRFRQGADDATWPAEATRLPESCVRNLASFTHVYVGGVGAPTKSVMGGTQAWLAVDGRAKRLDEASAALCLAFHAAFSAPAAATILPLVKAVQAQRRCLEGNPVFPKDVHRELALIAGEGSSWSYKTTGAGGEDALLLVGSMADVQDAARALRRLGWVRLEAGFETGAAGMNSGVRVSRRSAHV